MPSVQGTYSYMSPEVHDVEETSTMVDTYSFGVLCVYILSNKFHKPLYALMVDEAGTHVVVSEWCTITESNLNVQSVNNCNMQVSITAKITQAAALASFVSTKYSIIHVNYNNY